MINYKYPRTSHLTISPGGTKDDKKLKSDSIFLNKEIIITAKLDGSNLCLTNKDVFARSHSSAPKHSSFDLAKSFHNNIKYNIPENLYIYCEYLFAKHSIGYNNLPSYFAIFNILDISNNVWLSWDDINIIANNLNMLTAPILFSGEFASEKDLHDKIGRLVKEKEFGADEREGIVIRSFNSFNKDEFKNNVAKWVRSDHVLAEEDHWQHKEIIKNNLKI